MSILLDVVPNHMGINDPCNAWWLDVLENGPSSLFAPFFDIAWEPSKPELHDRVLLPVLEDQYGAVLEAGKLNLAFAEGGFRIEYYDNRFPVAPGTYRAGAAGVAGASAARPANPASGARARKHHHGGGLPARPQRAGRRAPPRTGAREGEHQAPAGGGVAVGRRARSPGCSRRLRSSTGSPASRTASTRSTACWRSRRTGWRTGGWRAKRSTTAASSISGTWPPSVSKTRSSLTRRTRSRCASWPRARSGGCAWTIPTGCSIPQRISAGCRKPTCWPCSNATARAGQR